MNSQGTPSGKSRPQGLRRTSGGKRRSQEGILGQGVSRTAQILWQPIFRTIATRYRLAMLARFRIIQSF